jgi:CheY-like chemotaxis protein
MASVLVVDDDRLLRLLFTRVLQQLGHQVVALDNGYRALRHLAEAPVELVITDIMMPDMDGLELIRQVRTGWPTIKILAASAGSAIVGTNYLRAAKRFGADETLQKPCTGDEIAAAVNRLLAAGTAPQSSPAASPAA